MYESIKTFHGPLILSLNCLFAQKRETGCHNKTTKESLFYTDGVIILVERNQSNEMMTKNKRTLSGLEFGLSCKSNKSKPVGLQNYTGRSWYFHEVLASIS